MFKFRRRSHAPLRDARSAQRWLATLPPNDPLLVQREVLSALGAAMERTARRTPSVLSAVFRVDAQTKAAVREEVRRQLDSGVERPHINVEVLASLKGH